MALEHPTEVIEIRKLGQKYAYASLQMHEAIAQQAGFASTDHKYLGFFLQRGSLTAGELAQLTGLTTGAVTGLIRRFERKGLVQRLRDETDGRKVIVVPDVPKIAALLKPLYSDFQQDSEDLIASFSSTEQQVIARYLQRALALAETTRQRLTP